MHETRYDRQIDLAETGRSGQQKLAAARLAIIGAGGLGSALLFGLAGSGIGHLTLIDDDQVSLSNLNRQFLYTPEDIGRNKSTSAAFRLKTYRPDLDMQIHCEKLTALNSQQLLAGHDLIIAAVDNQQARYNVNQAACQLQTPWIDAAVHAFYGYLSLITPGTSACFACQNGPLPAEPAHAKTRQQVMGTTPAVLGAMQADLAVTWILGCSQIKPGWRYYYNGKNQTLETVQFEQNQHCPVCAE